MFDLQHSPIPIIIVETRLYQNINIHSLRQLISSLLMSSSVHSPSSSSPFIDISVFSLCMFPLMLSICSEHLPSIVFTLSPFCHSLLSLGFLLFIFLIPLWKSSNLIQSGEYLLTKSAQQLLQYRQFKPSFIDSISSQRRAKSPLSSCLYNSLSTRCFNIPYTQLMSLAIRILKSSTIPYLTLKYLPNVQQRLLKTLAVLIRLMIQQHCWRISWWLFGTSNTHPAIFMHLFFRYCRYDGMIADTSFQGQLFPEDSKLQMLISNIRSQNHSLSLNSSSDILWMSNSHFKVKEGVLVLFTLGKEMMAWTVFLVRQAKSSEDRGLERKERGDSRVWRIKFLMLNKQWLGTDEIGTVFQLLIYHCLFKFIIMGWG